MDVGVATRGVDSTSARPAQTESSDPSSRPHPALEDGPPHGQIAVESQSPTYQISQIVLARLPSEGLRSQGLANVRSGTRRLRLGAPVRVFERHPGSAGA